MDTDSRTERDIEDAFSALLCSDPELLNAEFDAIVGANWGQPPAAEPGQDTPNARGGGPASAFCSPEPRSLPALLTVQEHSGPQRSPPAHRPWH
jgi:hypothetical protein